MNRFALGLAIACGLIMGADAPPTKPRVLFDGRTLDGWKPTGYRAEGEVKVEEGAMVIAEGDPMSGVTTTRTDLPKVDYELTYEARRVKGGDFFAAATFPVGASFITFVNGGWGGGVTGLSSLNGADASENETTQFFDYKEGTWYTFRVRVTAEAIVGFIDDKTIFAVDHKGREVGTRVETRRNQPLGFATYRTTGAIRKVEVRGLTPKEVAATNTLAR